MHSWPHRPVETVDPRCFVPPHCPWPACTTHRDAREFRFYRHSGYFRRCDQRRVPRFVCRTCGRSFSQQSFSFTYYLKRPELAPAIAAALLAGSAHRQIARSLGCAPSTITRLSARLGRHALLLLALSLERLERIEEPIVYDDFESFFFCQEFAVGMGTPAGQQSWFIYGLDYAPHRRGGRRSPAQRARRRKLSLAPRYPYRQAFGRVLNILAAKLPERGRLRLISDEQPEYGTALRQHPEHERFDHRSYANPKRPYKGAPRSRRAVERDREMFATDLLHGLIRHSLANHKRETIAFARRLNALLERGFLFVIWRNFVKSRTERRSDRTTPAMAVGLTCEPWNWARVLAQRLFPARQTVPEPWMRIYRRQILTPEVGRNVEHRLVQAM